MNWRIFFTPDDGGQGGGESVGDSGSAEASIESAAESAVANTPADESTDTGVGATAQQPIQEVSNEPFFQVDLGRGNVRQFRSKEELKEAMKELHGGSLRREDYTRKTQELAEQRKQFEKERESIKKYNDFLKNNPHVRNKLDQYLKQGTTGDVAVDKARAYADEVKSEIQKEMEELKSWKSERERQERQQKAIQALKQKYQNFSEDNVRKLMSSFDANDPVAIMELFHHAFQGQNMGPTQQARMAQAQQQKQQARMVPGGGAPSPSAGDASSIDEAYERAMREIQSG